MLPESPDYHVDPHALRRRRLLFRATHRGTYENDILIGGYVRARLEGFDADALDALEALIELPDAELGDWLTGRAPIPAVHDHPMLRAIRASAEAGEGHLNCPSSMQPAP